LNDAGQQAIVGGEKLTQNQDDRNVGVLQAWLPWWVINTMMNYGIVLDDFQKQDCSIATLQKPNAGPAVIVGSGPSLDKTAPLLGEWTGAVFCAGSNAKIAARYGHKPEYVVVFDGGVSVVKQLRDFDWSGTTLITHPAAHPQVVKEWSGERRYYLMMHPGHPWFEETNPIAFGNFDMTARYGLKSPYVKVAILNAGCTAVNAIQIAHFLGHDPLFLIGVDFGYPNWVDRATAWDLVDGEWKSTAPYVGPRDRPMHMSDNGIPTTEEQIDYKLALMAVWKIDKPTLFDCSDGIITEVPKVNFKEVVENGGRGFKGLSHDEVVRVTDEFLSRVQPAKPADPERDEHRAGEAVRADGDSGVE